MPPDSSAWLVLCRDVTASVRIDGQDAVWLSLVLDTDTGLVLSTAPGADLTEALHAGCLTAASSTASGQLPVRRPAQIWARETLVPAVTTAAAQALLNPPPVIPTAVIPEAEDIFDSLVQVLSGRPLVTAPPSTELWQALYDELARFATRRPWERWDDDEPLRIELTTNGKRSSWVAVIMGAAGIQQGLALYPGRSAPAALTDPTSSPEDAMMPGSLLVFLDGTDECPIELIDKATRHHWPDALDVFPHCLTIDAVPQPCELDEASALALLALVTAVRTHAEHDPVEAATTKDRLTGPAEEQLRFTVRRLNASARSRSKP